MGTDVAVHPGLGRGARRSTSMEHLPAVQEHDIHVRISGYYLVEVCVHKWQYTMPNLESLHYFE